MSTKWISPADVALLASVRAKITANQYDDITDDEAGALYYHDGRAYLDASSRLTHEEAVASLVRGRPWETRRTWTMEQLAVDCFKRGYSGGFSFARYRLDDFSFDALYLNKGDILRLGLQRIEWTYRPKLVRQLFRIWYYVWAIRPETFDTLLPHFPNAQDTQNFVHSQRRALLEYMEELIHWHGSFGYRMDRVEHRKAENRILLEHIRERIRAYPGVEDTLLPLLDPENEDEMDVLAFLSEPDRDVYEAHGSGRDFFMLRMGMDIAHLIGEFVSAAITPDREAFRERVREAENEPTRLAFEQHAREALVDHVGVDTAHLIGQYASPAITDDRHTFLRRIRDDRERTKRASDASTSSDSKRLKQ